MSQTRLSTLLTVVALSAGACRQKPVAAPPPPSPPPAPSASAAPPPPPTPKSCKSLDDKCSAKADTSLEIGEGAASFHPPSGWTYAHESATSVAVAPGTVAALAFTTSKKPWLADTDKAIDKLLDRLEITKLARKALRTRLRRAQTKLDADSGLKIELWEVNKHRQFGHPPRMKGKPSSVLVIVTKLPDNRAVVGVGAVLKPGGDSDVPAIMKAVKSLRSGK